ncbi:hypothetical protein [Hahella ganghwensis]|uniref:hypothetical protein n=1 Tax=Hahella ganghwensis TaxID=286420 RepID=UPI000366F9D3|nr:hypothetical protein [Hahella ganghwensis]
MKIEFKIIEGPLESKPEIVRVEFDPQRLTVELDASGHSSMISVVFDYPTGFRVLDEGDLLEFWDTFSLKDGWLYEIVSGGWLDLESKRSGFMSQHLNGIREYLIVGISECISVLTTTPPTFFRDSLGDRKDR